MLNLLLARWLTTKGYGAFAVGFASFLFVAGFHNVLLLEPMSVFGPANYADSPVEYFRAQLRVHFLLTMALSALLLLVAAGMPALGADRELVLTVAASAVAFPLVLVLWLVRRMCYVIHRPVTAVWASAGYFLCLLAGIYQMRGFHAASPGAAILVMAGASAVASLVPLSKLGLLSLRTETACPWMEVLRENWVYGRWLVASTTFYSLANQAQTYLAAGLLGLGAAGVLRAMQIPSLVMTQVVSAIALLLLPAMAREYGLGRMDHLRKKAMWTSIVLTGLSLVYVATLGFLARPIEQLMYADKFSSSAWLIPVLGLVPVCNGFLTGFSMALRASQKPQFDLLANAVAAPVGLVTALIFIRLWGISGAAFSLVAGTAASGLVFFWSYLRQTGNE